MSNYNSQLQSNNTDLQTVLQTLQTKAAGVAQATPVISVNSTNGLITATAGAKSSTHQLAFQPAKTITPSSTSQVAVSSGYYTGGSVVVAGDSDLVAENIKSGVNIFGVTGTYIGSGGGDTSVEDGLVTRTASTYTNNRVTSIGSYAFYNCSKLTSVSFQKVTTIGSDAFYGCSSLVTINFPAAKTFGSTAFYMCNKLTSVSFPAATMVAYRMFYMCNKLTSVSFPVATVISNYAFQECNSLVSISFPAATTIRQNAFYGCDTLSKIYLTASSVCALSGSNAFSNTGIWTNKGSIFVPTSLVSSYKTATNWTYFSNRIFGI